MKLFGVSIDAIRREEALKRLSRPQIIFTPNPEILLEAHKNTRFREALAKGTLMLPDGHGLQVVSTLLRLRSRALRLLLYFPALILFLFWKRPFCRVIPEVIHGSDFMDDVLRFAAEGGLRVFFLGGQKGVARSAAEHFLKKYPELQVVGTSAADPGLEAFEEVKRARAQILLVAYGAPKQELWISEHASRIPGLVHAMAVGGSFDFYSGNVKRAPRLLRVLGLEWLWRLMMNPWQRARRIWRAVVQFPVAALFQL